MNIKELIEREAEKYAKEIWADHYQNVLPESVIEKGRKGYADAAIHGANFALGMDRWVKVDDGLPEDKVNVLAYDSHRDSTAVCYTLKGIWIVNKDFVDGFDCTTYEGAKITHWQPLPKLPQ